MTRRYLAANLIKAQAVVDVLEEEISAVECFLLVLFDEFGRCIAEDYFLLFFILLSVRKYANLRQFSTARLKADT